MDPYIHTAQPQFATTSIIYHSLALFALVSAVSVAALRVDVTRWVSVWNSAIDIVLFVWHKAYYAVLKRPLKYVYLYGMGWNMLGGWGGASNAHICASLSQGSHPEFWSSSRDARLECQRMIDARFESIFVLFQFIFALCVAAKMLLLWLHHVTTVRPLLAELRALRLMMFTPQQRKNCQ